MSTKVVLEYRYLFRYLAFLHIPSPQFLRSRMEILEAELMAERESRRKVEEDLQQLRATMKRR